MNQQQLNTNIWIHLPTAPTVTSAGFRWKWIFCLFSPSSTLSGLLSWYFHIWRGELKVYFDRLTAAESWGSQFILEKREQFSPPSFFLPLWSFSFTSHDHHRHVGTNGTMIYFHFHLALVQRINITDGSRHAIRYDPVSASAIAQMIYLIPSWNQFLATFFGILSLLLCKLFFPHDGVCLKNCACYDPNI